MRASLTIAAIVAGCTGSHGASEAGPWLEWGARPRFEGGWLWEATCEETAPAVVHVRVHAYYDIVPEAIDDEAYVFASFDVDRSILDGTPHDVRGWIDVPSEYLRDPDAEGIVFTPADGHDPAIHRAVAIPSTIWDAPTTGRFFLSGVVSLGDPCPIGSMQLLATGDAVPYGPAEAFMPFEPQPWRPIERP